MPDLNLRPVASSSTSDSTSGAKPIPSPSILKPWQFDYSPSPDGKDLNLLIMFHGLGDTKAAFAGLGKQLNLPSTAVLSLQAPDQIPLLEEPAWSWYNTFTPLFEPLPNPNPSSALPKLRTLLETLTSSPLDWTLPQIHLFGWGQGATMALELASDVGKKPFSSSSASSGSPASSGRRLGSVVAICGDLISFPATALELETPIAFFTRLNPQSQLGQKAVNGVKRGFKVVKVMSAKGGGGDMPKGREEWEGVMKFWGEVLGRDEGWKGDGEVFEVVR